MQIGFKGYSVIAICFLIALLVSVSLPAFEKNFSAEENWALEWDSGTVPDGNYSFEITACSSASCSKKSFEIFVANSGQQAIQQPSGDLHIFTLIPSNVLSAFYLQDSETLETK